VASEDSAKPSTPRGEDPLVELVERLRKGDDEALGPFIEATQRYAFRLARSLLGDDEQCKDVVQDAYLVVYREIARLRDVKAFRTWFSRIVVNRCKRLLKGGRTESLDVLIEAGHAPAVAGEQAGVELREDLKRALATLTEIDRSVLMLREVMQLSYDEIASTLGIPIGTVRSRLSEARRRLIAAWHGGRPTSSLRRKAGEAVEERSSHRNRLLRAVHGARLEVGNRLLRVALAFMGRGWRWAA
jgi:RNA polymerase sigma-70 factor (ECF subfamily)